MPRLRLKDVADDVEELKDRFSQHTDEHVADTKLLASIVESMSEHRHNAHGKASTIKQGGAVGLGVTLLYLAAELVRTFLL